jgi:hypothetical protein
MIIKGTLADRFDQKKQPAPTTHGPTKPVTEAYLLIMRAGDIVYRNINSANMPSTQRRRLRQMAVDLLNKAVNILASHNEPSPKGGANKQKKGGQG